VFNGFPEKKEILNWILYRVFQKTWEFSNEFYIVFINNSLI